MNKKEVQIKVAELQRIVGMSYKSTLNYKTYIVDNVNEFSSIENPDKYEIRVVFHKEPIELGDQPLNEQLDNFNRTYLPIV